MRGAIEPLFFPPQSDMDSLLDLIIVGQAPEVPARGIHWPRPEPGRRARGRCSFRQKNGIPVISLCKSRHFPLKTAGKRELRFALWSVDVETDSCPAMEGVVIRTTALGMGCI